MRILLAGGAGYIGSHTAVALVEAGHDAVLLDDLSNASGTTADRIAQITETSVPLVMGNAAADADVVSAFEEHGPFDAIVHLAAFKAVGQSMQMPLEYYANNLSTTWALLRMRSLISARDSTFREARCASATSSSFGVTNLRWHRSVVTAGCDVL